MAEDPLRYLARDNDDDYDHVDSDDSCEDDDDTRPSTTTRRPRLTDLGVHFGSRGRQNGATKTT